MDHEARPRREIIEGVAAHVVWWVNQRRTKLKNLRHDTHAVNPFLWPLTMAMHGYEEFRELAAFQLGGHLVEGHATGFGKLIDEKILPGVFGSTKLDKAYRQAEPGFNEPEYDNIDHLVPGLEDAVDLLSLKAGRWSIQLGQAVQLNRSLQVLLEKREKGLVKFDRIVIGVFYGTPATLTDKYSIIKGVHGGATHDIRDISAHVDIQVGRQFWSWINGDQQDTDEWVLEGVQEGFRQSVEESGSLADLYEAFIDDYAAEYERYFNDGRPDWLGLLRDVNGQ